MLQRYMLIYRNTEGVHVRKRLGIPALHIGIKLVATLNFCPLRQVLSHTAGTAALVGWAAHAKRPAGQTMAVRFRWTAASVSATRATTVHLVTCSVADEALAAVERIRCATAVMVLASTLAGGESTAIRQTAREWVINV